MTQDRIEQLADLFRQRDAVNQQIEALLVGGKPSKPATPAKAKKGQEKGVKIVCADCGAKGHTTEKLIDATCGKCGGLHVSKVEAGANRPCGCGPKGRHAKDCPGV